MTLFFFSTTGNSLWTARHFDPSPVNIATLDGCGADGEGFVCVEDPEAIGLVCPVYFGDLPAPVKRWLERTRLESPYKFAILTCGNTPGLAVSRLARTGGFDYVDALRMVDNYFPMFDVEDQVRNVGKKHVDSHLADIMIKVEARYRGLRPPGIYDRIAALWLRLNPLSPEAYRRFYADAALCDGCGVCARLCPECNITYASDKTPRFGSRCITCGACRHNCPKGAIRYRGEKSAYAYRHPGVSLKDLLLR